MAMAVQGSPVPPRPHIHTLLIDNYDSYTYNLYQLIAQVNGAPPTVVYNDETTVEQVLGRLAAGEFHNVVISPGPGTPTAPGDIGLCLALIRAAPAVPILGVCLGFQALALAHGGRVAPAPEPVHGRLSAIAHSGHPLFSGIPSGEAYQVVRYHSLVVEEASLPPELEAVAWTAGSRHHALGVDSSNGSNGSAGADDAANQGERLLMAVAHRSLPYLGVQYHPESVATAYGDRLLKNFRDMTVAFYGSRLAHASVPNGMTAANGAGGARATDNGGAVADGEPTLRIAFREVPGALLRVPGGAQGLFEALISARCGLEDSFWLDSASAAQGRGRFSYMGGRGGPFWRRITYRLADPEDQGAPGGLTVEDAGGRVTARRIRFWAWLSGEMAGWGRVVNEPDASEALPFDFWGGLVGYLGYELKAESGGRAAHVAPTPDAAFFLVDQILALDHETGSVYAVAAGRDGDDAPAAWVEATVAAVARMAAGGAEGNAHAATNGVKGCANYVSTKSPPPFCLREPRTRYLENVGACMTALHAGDSYELCLTTELRRESSWGTHDAWKLYTTLREVNPAPYAAWLQFECDAAHGGPLAICCSSPERFLRGERARGLEAKPIKGTAPRAADPASDAAAAAALAASEKDRAENLMIVDLLRNDLGRVCEPGSVNVPKLMAIESFATVHQMVSTVRGRRRADAPVAAAVAAAFPGGSMTGAPKVRSMAILDRLETGPRGIYSGSLGYFSFGAGAFDLNIVIRTAVVGGGAVRVGAGGAVVVQSDPEGEYEEMRLKAAALLRAVAACDGSSSDSGAQAEVLED